MQKLVVLVSGKIGAGKDTASQMLQKALGDKVELASFARPLKEMCRVAFTPFSDYFNKHYARGPADHIGGDSWFERKTPLTRLIIQAVGTEIVRQVDPDYWIILASRAVADSRADVVIFTDWRFPSEARGLQENFPCLTVRVERDRERPGIEHRHVSETALDDWPNFDYVIQNNGSLSHLKRDVAALADWLVSEHLD